MLQIDYHFKFIELPIYISIFIKINKFTNHPNLFPINYYIIIKIYKIIYFYKNVPLFVII